MGSDQWLIDALNAGLELWTRRAAVISVVFAVGFWVGGGR